MKNKKRIIALTSIAILLGVALVTSLSSSDLQGARRNNLNVRSSSPSSPNSNMPATATQSTPIEPLLTIVSYTNGNNGNLVSNVRLEWNNASCDESSYSHLGYWKLNTNLPIEANALKFWTYFGPMENYKIQVGTSPNSSNITSYEVTFPQNYFTATHPNGTFTIPSNQDVYVTLLGKYKPAANLNHEVTGGVAIKDQGVLGDFIGLLGNETRITTSHVQNNQTNFTAGFEEINLNYDTCNKVE